MKKSIVTSIGRCYSINKENVFIRIVVNSIVSALISFIKLLLKFENALYWMLDNYLPENVGFFYKNNKNVFIGKRSASDED